MSDTDPSATYRVQAEWIARALDAREEACSRNEYYTVEEVLQDLDKILQKAGDKRNS